MQNNIYNVRNENSETEFYVLYNLMLQLCKLL